MSARLALHLLVLVGLAGVGGWLVYTAMVSEPLPFAVGGYAAAAYWFALLIYGLFSLVLYYLLRRQSGRALLGAHALALGVALSATAAVLVIGQRHAAREGTATEAPERAALPPAGYGSAPRLA